MHVIVPMQQEAESELGLHTTRVVQSNRQQKAAGRQARTAHVSLVSGRSKDVLQRTP